MKVFVPASSSTDSTALLYHVLKNTEHEVVSRIVRLDTNGEDLEMYPQTCGWLKKNVRDFDYNFSDTEEVLHENTMVNLHYNEALLANKFKVDTLYLGYNTYNFAPSNWFFNTNEPIENFYKVDDNKFLGRRGLIHRVISQTINCPIYWPFMNRDTKPMGRWETYESMPKELRSLTSSGCNRCGQCMKCKVRYLYYLLKKAGKTAEEIDDLIQKAGRFGKYLNINDNDPWNANNRTRAFRHLVVPPDKNRTTDYFTCNEMFEFDL